MASSNQIIDCNSNHHLHDFLPKVLVEESVTIYSRGAVAPTDLEMIWYDTSSSAFKFHNGTSWVTISGGGGGGIVVGGFFDNDSDAAAGGIALNGYYKLTDADQNDFGLPKGIVKQRVI